MFKLNHENQIKVLTISALLIALLLFYGFVIKPYQENKPYRECVRTAGELRAMVEATLDEEYDDGGMSDERWLKEMRDIEDGYEAAVMRCKKELKP